MNYLTLDSEGKLERKFIGFSDEQKKEEEIVKSYIDFVEENIESLEDNDTLLFLRIANNLINLFVKEKHKDFLLLMKKYLYALIEALKKEEELEEIQLRQIVLASHQTIQMFKKFNRVDELEDKLLETYEKVYYEESKYIDIEERLEETESEDELLEDEEDIVNKYEEIHNE